MADEKIVILGAAGMLGSDLSLLLKHNGINALCLDLPDFDITDKARLRNVLNEANTVINCAAYTNVDKAELEPEIANTINAKAVEALGEIAAEKDIYVVHISTDFVFDGKSAPPPLHRNRYHRPHQ